MEKISRLEQLLHDRWYRWEAALLSLRGAGYSLPVSEAERLLHRGEVAEEDYRKVAKL